MAELHGFHNHAGLLIYCAGSIFLIQILELWLAISAQFLELQMEEFPGPHNQAELLVIFYMVYSLPMQILGQLSAIMVLFSEHQKAVCLPGENQSTLPKIDLQ